MGVVEHFRSQGYKILWPVKPYFVEGLNRAYPNVTFVADNIIDPNIFNIKRDEVVDDLRIIPVRWADVILGLESKYWMKAKYMLFNLPWENWKEHAVFKRDTKHENTLWAKLGIAPREEYNLVNSMYKSNFAGSVPIKVENGLRNIEMEVLDGYSLFDWSQIIEHATNIHVVNSAIFYLLELLNLSAKEVHLYSRHPEEQAFPYIDYLMSKEKNYILHP